MQRIILVPCTFAVDLGVEYGFGTILESENAVDKAFYFILVGVGD